MNDGILLGLVFPKFGFRGEGRGRKLLFKV